ncbi:MULTISPECIES: YlbF family regulator [Clostridia]|uniref:YlbF family regulator n=1 Tax=Clostridium sp. CCUG 7971 TaxID=2811414 RepID=UPI001ABB95A5|nr:YlbF family regulator [Clostridium sp. CCUG 7971]MBO3445605.1 YlbF family regulator [Clostridium sp. CCUG 7971]
MDINHKAKEFASYVKNTKEFKAMNKSKADLDKNRSLKKKLDSYINKKNSIYSNYRMEDASIKMNQLNQEYSDFFNSPIVSNYMQSTKQFNSMMEQLYKTIEKELLR